MSATNIQWSIRTFEDLKPAELYAILQLRNEVFVVEQNCVFQDADDKDQFCNHLMGWLEGRLVAYTRLVPPGVSYAEPSIGRVVTSPTVRRTGAGKELMDRSITAVKSLYGNVPQRIGAQLYLKQFYAAFGFMADGDIYLEDGIEHIEMVLSPV